MHDEIQKQLEVLKTRIRFFIRKTVADHLKALEKIGELGTPYDAQYIVHHIFSANKSISQKTAIIVRQLLTKEEVRTAWPNLYGSFSYCYGYDSINKKTLKKFEKYSPEEASHLYGIASLNHSGYVREEALECLKNIATSEALPYVLLRLNDWVPQVRVRAKEVLAKLLPAISVVDLVKYYSLIEWLEKTERVKLKDLQSNIFMQIRDPRNRDDLFKAMQNFSLRKRIFCWKILAEEVINDSNLIDKAIADPAPEIRQWAAYHLPKAVNSRDRLDTLLGDSAVRVRYAALKAIPQDNFADYTEVFEAALFDDSRSIREYARFVLRLHGNGNYVVKYRQRLSELKDRANPGLVAGLAEVAVREDIPMIKGFIEHKKPAVRMAVLTSLNRLEAEAVDSLYILGLQDNNAKVRNVCISILHSGYHHLRPELEALLENGNLKSQKATLKVLSYSGGLHSLKNILFALTIPYKELQEIAWKYLASWHYQYASRLWFSFTNDTYEHTMILLDEVKKTKIEPPYYARNAWNDLQTIMRIIKRI